MMHLFQIVLKLFAKKEQIEVRFYEGKVDKYTWHDVGSSYLPGEDTAAFLLAQLESAEEITQRRLTKWNAYYEAFQALEQRGDIRRPVIPKDCTHNAHMFYVLVESSSTRSKLIEHFNKQDIHPVFHYIPLHSSPGGQKFGRVWGTMMHTDDLSGRLLRLPLWLGLKEYQSRVIDAMNLAYGAQKVA